MNDWRRGFDLATLQRYADLFRARHKPLVFGAFGLVKERDIANAMAEKRLLWSQRTESTMRDDEIQACVITHRLRHGSTHRDFCGRELKLPAGALIVSAFACRNPWTGAFLLDGLKTRAAGAPVWVEAFEEDDTAMTALRCAGFTYAMTKVAAGSELKGMYSSSGESLEALPEAERATLQACVHGFASDEEIAEVVYEIRIFEGREQMWAQHYSSYNKRQSWSAIALRGYDPMDHSFIIAPREMSQGWKELNPERLDATVAWTVAAEHFPSARRLVDRIPGAFDRVRFMRLAGKGGELTRHADITDRDAGIADGKLARLHIPLLTNEGVKFCGWDIHGSKIELALPAGALCYLDQRKPHAVRNESPAERIHVVADVVSSPELRRLLFNQPEGSAMQIQEPSQ